MPRRVYKLPEPSMSREKNLVMILVAILVALILWNSFWGLVKFALFILIVYIIYQALRHYA